MESKTCHGEDLSASPGCVSGLSGGEEVSVSHFWSTHEHVKLGYRLGAPVPSTPRIVWSGLNGIGPMRPLGCQLDHRPWLACPHL